ncbi:Crp/Fnr family transcriptional regulator [Ureibacillus acetophenoni]|uniref:CRP-like cAMP-binding protein n=1 Tax=Ureibacillus acetophenoni TaxID=614649 RepID=A0A285UEW4_9BACL|nr:Crp/Fnr family transcriptional regulator [Ureibacillus acetophenoni]SOC40217.1 CRP-like cAMP-binding protein [Ureibacillus acetophenoni]
MFDSKVLNSWTPYLKYGERRFYKRKSVVYRENEKSVQGFYYLKSGFIKISLTIHAGDEQIIDIVSDDTPFGEQVVDGEQYFSTATAMNESVVYFFPMSIIETLIMEDENFRNLFYHGLTKKLKTLSNNLLFDSLPSERLLARTLLILRDKFISDQFPFTQQELCRYTNLNRNTVYHIFKKWKDEIASFDKRKIIIHNIDLLEKIAVNDVVR